MLKNIFSNWLGLLVLGLISFFLTPVMVHSLGNMYYGMWVLVGSVVDYSGLLDMGMRATLFRYVAYFRGANQRDSLNQTFATGMLIAVSVMVLSFLIFTVLAFILPPFFRFAGTDKVTFAWVVALMGASVSISLPGQFLSAYIRGLERFDLYNLGMSLAGIVRGLMLLVILKLGFGVISVSFVVLGNTIFYVFLHWLLVKRADSELEVSFSNLNWKRTREMCNFGFYSFVNNSGETIRNSTDSFVIGRVLSVSLITTFSIATRLVDYFRILSGGISGPVMVRLSELSGKAREEGLRDEFLRSTRFCMLFSMLIGGLLLLDGQALIRIWIGPNFQSSYQILVVLTIAYIAMFGQVPTQLLIFARAKYHKAISWLTLAEGVANLFLSIFWARKYGVIGVAIGTAVPLLASKLLVQPWYALKDLNMSVWRYIKEGIAGATLVGGLFVGISWLLLRNLTVPVSFYALAVTCTWQVLFFGVMAYFLGLPTPDRTTLRITGRRIATSLGIARSL